MRAAKTKPSPPAQPVKVRLGACLAFCAHTCRCPKQHCRCEAYVFARSDGPWRICECGHTQQIHEQIEAPNAN